MSEEALQRIAENKKTKAATLNLGTCGLSKLPPELLECVWLTELRLNDNEELSDLSLLKDLQYLRLLNVSNTQMSDLSPLKDLKNLTLSHPVNK